MMIGEYLQGCSKTDYDLFAAVGRIALDPEVHKELGNSVSSLDGDWWILSVRPAGNADGFVNMRVYDKASCSIHIRFAYALDNKIRTQLVKRAILKAKELKASVVYTNEKKQDELYPALGFKVKPTKRPGDYVRWEITL